ncbi:hypothetical protein M3Y95_00295600 [Aphelenchoides besseyi]|nr:hypothetical protein M3Y95_00295600 [Aphelenchoides besseyi]
MRSILTTGFCFFLVIYLANAKHQFASKDEIGNMEHMKQHLDRKINVEKMDQQKARFHYFKLHDTNQNGNLDGLEIMKAITHNHEEPGDKPREVMSDEELEKLVDAVLSDLDTNNDGRIDFAEYLKRAA